MCGGFKIYFLKWRRVWFYFYVIEGFDGFFVCYVVGYEIKMVGVYVDFVSIEDVF